MADPVLWKDPRSGIYKIRLYHGVRRIHQESCKTRDLTEAQARLQDYQRRLGDVPREFGRVPRLGELVDEALEYFKLNRAPHTYRNYKAALRSLVSVLGDLPLERLNFGAVERFKAVRSRDGLKPAVINTHLMAVSSMCSYAKVCGYLRERPQITKLRVDKSRVPRFLSRDDAQRLLEASRTYPRLFTFVNLGLHTGMRPGEICNLKPDDVDFRANVIHVRQTKSKRDRTVPIHPRLREYLLEGPRLPVYCYSEMGRRFRRVCGELGWSGVSPHTLRHTFAAHCAMQGIPLDTLRNWLGHTDLKVTQIYLHLAEDHSMLSMARLPSLGETRGPEVIPFDGGAGISEAVS